MVRGSVSRYFNDFASDLLTLRDDLDLYEYSDEYYTAAASMLQTGKVLRHKDRELDSPMPELQTELGRRVAALYFGGERFTKWKFKRPGFCSEAEWKLAKSLRDDEIFDAKKPSPIILTIDGSAVAVGKQVGESTWYGLVDVPERRFFAGVFSAIAHSPNADKQVPRCGAYRYELPASSSNGNYRFSLYAVPDEYRESLYVKADKNCAIVTEVSHRDIVAAATELLETAQPLN